MLLRRRELLRSAAALAPTFLARTVLAASPFWNKEPAPSWSAKQIQQLRTNSPWARKVDVTIGGNPASSMGNEGSAGGARGGSGRGGGGNRNGGAAANAGGAPMQAVVSWTSAKPLIDSGATLPSAFDGKYAVSVAGIPPALLIAAIRALPESAAAASQSPEERQKAVADAVLSRTTLAVKGRDPEKAALFVQSADRATLTFGFDRSALPITAADRDIAFDMRLGALEVSARFQPKQMLYNGDLVL